MKQNHVLLVAWVLDILFLGHSCTQNVVFSSESDLKLNKDLQRYLLETTITFSIGIDEEVCFTLYDPDGPNRKETYTVSFNEVISVYNYKNAYDFAMARPVVTCLCDCPGGSDHCYPEMDTCGEAGITSEHCFGYYSADQPSKSCGLGSILGSAEVCCSIDIQEASSPDRYKALELSTPNTRGIFSIREGSNQRTEKNIPIDLENPGSFFYDTSHGIFQLSFDSPGQVSAVPPGWYFGESGKSHILTNVQINTLTEWDPQKLGWYKIGAAGNGLTVDETQVRYSFRGEAVNCDTDEINVQFASKFMRRESLTEAKPLEEFFKSEVKRAIRDDKKRKVEVLYETFPRINVRITVEGEKRVLQVFSRPMFDDFTAEVKLDRHSNRFIAVMVVNGNGTLHGLMRIRGEEVAHFDVVTPYGEDGPGNFSKYVQVTEWCDNSERTAEVCLHIGDYQNLRCKQVRCTVELMPTFSNPDWHVNYTIIEKDDLLKPSTWAKYLNPGEWFNGIKSWHEGVVMGVAVVGIVVVMGIVVKVCRALNCCYKVVSCCPKVAFKWMLGKRKRDKIRCDRKRQDGADRDGAESSKKLIKGKTGLSLDVIKLPVEIPPSPSSRSSTSSCFSENFNEHGSYVKPPPVPSPPSHHTYHQLLSPIRSPLRHPALSPFRIHPSGLVSGFTGRSPGYLTPSSPLAANLYHPLISPLTTNTTDPLLQALKIQEVRERARLMFEGRRSSEPQVGGAGLRSGTPGGLGSGTLGGARSGSGTLGCARSGSGTLVGAGLGSGTLGGAGLGSGTLVGAGLGSGTLVGAGLGSGTEGGAGLGSGTLVGAGLGSGTLGRAASHCRTPTPQVAMVPNVPGADPMGLAVSPGQCATLPKISLSRSGHDPPPPLLPPDYQIINFPPPSPSNF